MQGDAENVNFCKFVSFDLSMLSCTLLHRYSTHISHDKRGVIFCTSANSLNSIRSTSNCCALWFVLEPMAGVLHNMFASENQHFFRSIISFASSFMFLCLLSTKKISCVLLFKFWRRSFWIAGTSITDVLLLSTSLHWSGTYTGCVSLSVSSSSYVCWRTGVFTARHRRTSQTTYPSRLLMATVCWFPNSGG